MTGGRQEDRGKMSSANSERWRSLARVPLAALPTPLTPLPRFGRAIGAEVWLKRDDVGSVGLSGNKARKLEFLLADAERVGADIVVTAGAVQSNSARATAAAAAQLGLDCVLALSGARPRQPSGNLLIAGLVGARFEFVDGSWNELTAAARQLVLDLSAQGRHPYAIPIGASSALGTVGFVLAYQELVQQLDALGVEATRLYHASSSGGTQAGLVLGRELTGRGPLVHGVGVAQGLYPDMIDHCLRLAEETAGLLGGDVAIARTDFSVDMSQLGEGYGRPTRAGLDAISLLATSEGILADPIYTGKALAGLVAAAADGELDGPVVFWHTGGVPSVFDPTYGDSVWEASGATLCELYRAPASD